MIHIIIDNLPKDVKSIFNLAKEKSFEIRIEEKSSKNNPSYIKRASSTLFYQEAFEIINTSKPHWTVLFRNNSYFGEKDFWEFSGCTIANNEYGEVFIFILVDLDQAEEIFNIFGLHKHRYGAK